MAASEKCSTASFPNEKCRAPSLDGGVGWINTAGSVDLKDLHGKFVLLDFWCYCCINCMHIMPELKTLEHAYPNNLVVIGVHTAKFAAEQDSQNITDAVMRYEIEHPVVNDAREAIWNRYKVNSWPTLALIDPEGYLIYIHGGETKAEVLDNFLKSAVPYYRNKKLLDERPLRFDLQQYHAAQTPLRFPEKSSPTSRATGCSSPTATTTGSSSPTWTASGSRRSATARRAGPTAITRPPNSIGPRASRSTAKCSTSPTPKTICCAKSI